MTMVMMVIIVDCNRSVMRMKIMMMRRVAKRTMVVTMRMMIVMIINKNFNKNK